jgi:hypothetical protein
MDEDTKLDYRILYERVLRMKINELMQEPYDPPEDENGEEFNS